MNKITENMHRQMFPSEKLVDQLKERINKENVTYAKAAGSAKIIAASAAAVFIIAGFGIALQIKSSEPKNLYENYSVETNIAQTDNKSTEANYNKKESAYFDTSSTKKDEILSTDKDNTNNSESDTSSKIDFDIQESLNQDITEHTTEETSEYDTDSHELSGPDEFDDLNSYDENNNYEIGAFMLDTDVPESVNALAAVITDEEKQKIIDANRKIDFNGIEYSFVCEEKDFDEFQIITEEWVGFGYVQITAQGGQLELLAMKIENHHQDELIVIEMKDASRLIYRNESYAK